MTNPSGNIVTSSEPTQFRPKPIFVALTNDSLLLYDQIPLTIDDWFAPLLTYSLLITRKINQSKSDPKASFSENKFSEANSSYLFLTRHGTLHGTLTHFFQCLNKTELKTWSVLIEKQTDAAVNMIKHIDFCKSDNEKKLFHTINLY